MRKPILVAIGSLVTVVLLAVSFQPAFAATRAPTVVGKLGAPNITGYCQGLGASFTTNGGSAFNLVCHQESTGNQIGLNMNEVCAWSYPNQNPIAQATVVDPFTASADSWECFSAKDYQPLTGSAACKYQTQAMSYNVGGVPWGWHCAEPGLQAPYSADQLGPALGYSDFQRACQQEYPNDPNVLAVLVQYSGIQDGVDMNSGYDCYGEGY